MTTKSNNRDGLTHAFFKPLFSCCCSSGGVPMKCIIHASPEGRSPIAPTPPPSSLYTHEENPNKLAPIGRIGRRLNESTRTSNKCGNTPPCMSVFAITHLPAGQNFLGKFAMEIGTQHMLFAWSDIQEYRAIPTVDYRFTKARQVRSCVCICGRFVCVGGEREDVCVFANPRVLSPPRERMKFSQLFRRNRADLRPH